MRPLNFLERLLQLAGGKDGCVVSTAVQAAPLSHEFQVAALEAAARIVHRRHELLTVGLEAAALELERTEHEAQIETLQSDEPIARLLEDELATPLPKAPQPAWRLVVVGRGDGTLVLLFTIHHALADAATIQSFYSELFRVYEQLVRGETPDALSESKSSPGACALNGWPPARTRRGAAGKLRRGIARLLVPPGRWLYWVNQILIPSALDRLRPGDRVAVAPAAVTRVQCRSIPIGPLLAAARSQGVTVNSLVVSAFAGAYRESIVGGETVLELQIIEAMDLRRRLGLPQDRFGAFLFSVPTQLPVNPRETLAERARVHQQLLGRAIAQVTENLDVVEMIFSRRFVVDLRNRLAKRNYGRIGDLQLSNWGVHRISTGALFRLQRVMFRAGYELIGTRYQVGLVTVDDALNLCMGYQSPILADETAAEIAERAVHALEELGTAELRPVAATA